MPPLPWKRTFAWLLLASAPPAFLVFTVLALLMHENPFQSSSFGFGFHWTFPYQVILLYTGTYAVIGTIWIALWRHRDGWFRAATIVMALVTAMGIGSLLSGVLWSIYDLTTGWFPHGAGLLDRLADNLKLAVEFGWLIALGWNPVFLVLGILAAVTILHLTARRLTAGEDG
jgi:hypothetical protein